MARPAHWSAVQRRALAALGLQLWRPRGDGLSDADVVRAHDRAHPRRAPPPAALASDSAPAAQSGASSVARSSLGRIRAALGGAPPPANGRPERIGASQPVVAPPSALSMPPAGQAPRPGQAQDGPQTGVSSEVTAAVGCRPADVQPSAPLMAPPLGAPAPSARAPQAASDWARLEHAVAACTRCPELVRTRRNTVFGVGDRAARWMFIGEAPGAQEDRVGEPFVGPAGQLLDRMLAALGLSRGRDVFIANVLKCRPPNNRDPKPSEVAACSAYLRAQIEAVSPAVIVALGRFAAAFLLGREAVNLGEVRGRPLTYRLAERACPVVVTYHPAALLRTPAHKAGAWQDLLRAAAIVERESRARAQDTGRIGG